MATTGLTAMKRLGTLLCGMACLFACQTLAQVQQGYCPEGTDANGLCCAANEVLLGGVCVLTVIGTPVAPPTPPPVPSGVDAFCSNPNNASHAVCGGGSSVIDSSQTGGTYTVGSHSHGGQPESGCDPYDCSAAGLREYYDDQVAALDVHNCVMTTTLPALSGSLIQVPNFAAIPKYRVEFAEFSDPPFADGSDAQAQRHPGGWLVTRVHLRTLMSYSSDPATIRQYQAFVFTHEFVHHATGLSDADPRVAQETTRLYTTATAQCGR